MKTQSLNIFKKICLAAGLFCIVSSALLANTANTWTGGASDGNWVTAGNWTAGGPIYDNDYVALPGAVITYTSANNGANDLWINGDTTAGAAPILNINTTGTFTCGGGVFAVSSNLSPAVNNSGGVVNFTGGTLQRASGNASNLEIDVAENTYSSTNVSGTFNMGGTSGNPAIYWGGPSSSGIQVANSGTATGVFNVGGYSQITTAMIKVGEYGGNGTFSVTGGNASIHTTDMQLGGQGGQANGMVSTSCTFSATLDATGGSTIYSTNAVQIGQVSHFSLTLGTGFFATLNQVFTLIDSEAGPFTGTGHFIGLTEGSTISQNGYVFTASYLGTSTNTFGGEAFILTVTSVPEPQTWAMMAAGIGMLMGGRRMRRNG